jgi:hypothetical protein
LDVPGEIHIFDQCLAGLGHRRNGIPKSTTYEETLEALEDPSGDQHLAAAYHSLLKPRTQCVAESSQEFATTIKQLAHCTYPALPVIPSIAIYTPEQLRKPTTTTGQLQRKRAPVNNHTHNRSHK